MARPRYINATTLIVSLYTQTPSVRQVARQTRLSRWVVIDRLRTAGVPILAKDDAADLKRYVDQHAQDQARQQTCAAPTCSRPREAFTGVCAACRRELERPRPTRQRDCSWCAATATHGRLCYRCRKLADGIMSR